MKAVHRRVTRVAGRMLVMFAVVALTATACSSDTESSPSKPVGEPLVAGGLAAFTTSADDPAEGATIPEASGTTLEGEPMTIGPDSGRAQVIVFVAHWCPHCQAEVPRIVEHLASSPLPDDVDVVGVSTSVKPAAPNFPPDEWLAREQWTFPTLADDDDSTAASKFGLTSFPYFVAVDADGKVVVRGSGELTMAEFDAVVEAARSGTR